MRRDLLAAADRRLHRCTCGSWLYGGQDCAVCRLIAGEVAA